MRDLGINYTPWGDVPSETLFSLFSELGFRSTFFEMQSDAPCDRWVREARGVGLKVESVHAPFRRINDIWMTGEAGDAMLNALVDTVAFCAQQAIPIAVVHLSSGDAAPGVCDVGRDRFDRLIDVAVASGVTIAFENQRKLANLAFVMERYADVENVGFCWDIGHEMCFADGRQYMPLFGDKLRCTHIHDNNCVHNGDLHLIPFDGKVDLSRCMRQIRESRFEGTLTLELFPHMTDRYRAFDPQSYYERAWQAAVRLRDMTDA